jgi:hypothetical protein
MVLGWALPKTLKPPAVKIVNGELEEWASEWVNGWQSETQQFVTYL